MRETVGVGKRLVMVAAVLAVAGLGVGAARAGYLGSGLGTSPTPRHGGVRRNAYDSEDLSAYALLFMPLASMLRRRTEADVDDPFLTASDHEHRRDELGIIVDVLSIARLPASKKAIRHYARLNLDQANRYTSFLVRRGLMEVRHADLNRFVTTKRGYELLALLRQSKEELAPA